MLNFKILTTALVAIALSLGTDFASNAQQNNNTPETPSSTTQPAQPSQNASPTQSGQTSLSSSDRKFITQAAEGGLAEVQLGELASQRGSSDAVKQFGQRMVQDHTQANNQLQQLAAQKNVTLPKGIGKENQKVKQKLSKLSGASFDRAYINDMVQDHTKDVSSFQRQAQQAQDPDLKAFATQTLPILQEHLQMARSIANSTTPGNTTTPTNTR
ncbi:MAG: DUF4142 domain-containing protein [Stigonema ocellatum SAG 48.90 = DSM 106950]|nr:DUF4142 domain-containing protein [Stigonema ocellatum SAG 48.90 = DSM 106950]